MTHSSASVLLALVAVVGGCGGAVEGTSAKPSPSPAEPGTASGPPHPSCSGTPTLFVAGAPASTPTSVSTPGGPTVTWNAVDGFVRDVVTDGTSLYWTLSGATDGAIITAPIAAGSPAVLVNETGDGLPSHLTVHGKRLLWLEASAANATLSRVVTANVDGSAVRALTSFEGIADVAFDGSAAYVAEEFPAAGGGSTLVRIDAATGARGILLEGMPVASLAVDDANVYLLNASVVARLPKNGGVVTTIAQMPNLAAGGATAPTGGVASDDSFVYWAISGASPQAFSMPTGGGAAVELGRTAGTATFLQPHGGWIYFTSVGDPTNYSAIYRLAASGGSPSVVVPLSTAATANFAHYGGTTSSGRVALEGANVYWGAFDGTLQPSIFCIAE